MTLALSLPRAVSLCFTFIRLMLAGSMDTGNVGGASIRQF